MVLVGLDRQRRIGMGVAALMVECLVATYYNIGLFFYVEMETRSFRCSVGRFHDGLLCNQGSSQDLSGTLQGAPSTPEDYFCRARPAAVSLHFMPWRPATDLVRRCVTIQWQAALPWL